MDVFATEPCTDSPLFTLDQVVATPHLGASTDEAQERAGIAVAVSVRKALAGELVPDAVNVKGGLIAEEIRPSLPLVEKLGVVLFGLAGEVPVSIEVLVRGEIAAFDCSVLATSALVGLLNTVCDEDVTYVNAPNVALERGVTSTVTTDLDSPDHRNLITLKAVLADGTSVSVSGNLSGIRMVQKLIAVDAYDLDLIPSDYLIFLRYSDRPGIVGAVGNALGVASVNIAGMQVARDHRGGEALMALTVDSEVSIAVLDAISKEIGANSVRFVSLK